MIEVIDVTKRYGRHVILDKINFTVDKGEVLGFLGPNGAGKSTTMNIITGYISATEGQVKVDGIDMLEHPEKVKKKIGYLPEIPPLYPEMTVEEYLRFVCDIKKVSGPKREESLKQVMDTVRISDVKERLIRNLSKGYRQRIGIAQAIIGDPEVLILDEPTVGLDPNQIIEIRNLIKELGKRHTIILSSHILPEVSAICGRVLIINKGQIVAEGSPEELSQQFNYSSKILLRIKGDGEEAVKTIQGIENVVSVANQGVKEDNTVDILVESKKGVDIREQLFNAMSFANLPIYMMKPMNLTLEDIFAQVTTHEEVEK
ncbi:MAG TPA: ABC transporter [Clostridiaceae bacterium]|nr:ABC transporter [Clostridiaceae bacterium]